MKEGRTNTPGCALLLFCCRPSEAQLSIVGGWELPRCSLAGVTGRMLMPQATSFSASAFWCFYCTNLWQLGLLLSKRVIELQ